MHGHAHANRLLIPLQGALYVQDGEGAPLREIVPSGQHPALDPQLSPDGAWVAYVQDAELYVVSADGGAPRQMTDGARGTGKTHGLAEYIAQEEMGRSHGFWWSPDSRQHRLHRGGRDAYPGLPHHPSGQGHDRRGRAGRSPLPLRGDAECEGAARRRLDARRRAGLDGPRRGGGSVSRARRLVPGWHADRADREPRADRRSISSVSIRRPARERRSCARRAMSGSISITCSAR